MGGWKLPKSIWANPFTVKECGSAEIAVAKYKDWIQTQPVIEQLETLRGKTLGCWCKPKMCHGDALLELLGNT